MRISLILLGFSADLDNATSLVNNMELTVGDDSRGAEIRCMALVGGVHHELVAKRMRSCTAQAMLPTTRAQAHGTRGLIGTSPCLARLPKNLNATPTLVNNL